MLKNLPRPFLCAATTLLILGYPLACRALEPCKDPLKLYKVSTSASKDSLELSKDSINPSKAALESDKQPVQSYKDSLEFSKGSLEFSKESLEFSKDSIESSRDSLRSGKETVQSSKDSLEPFRGTLAGCKVLKESSQLSRVDSIESSYKLIRAAVPSDIKALYRPFESNFREPLEKKIASREFIALGGCEVSLELIEDDYFTLVASQHCIEGYSAYSRAEEILEESKQWASLGVGRIIYKGCSTGAVYILKKSR